MYSRREVTDHVTVMTKELYDNLQDGIDESKQAISELEESLAETKQDFSSQIQQGMGGIRYDPSRDMIIVQNPYTGKWIDWQETGKLVKPSTITITTETLKGQQVTLTIGDETYTSFFDQSDGTATFTVYSSGEATVTCGEYSMTITIDEKGGVTTSGSLENFNGYRIIHNGVLVNSSKIKWESAIGGNVYANTDENNRYYIRSVNAGGGTYVVKLSLTFPSEELGHFENKVLGIKGNIGYISVDYFLNTGGNSAMQYLLAGSILKDEAIIASGNLSSVSSSEVPLREVSVFPNAEYSQKDKIVKAVFSFACFNNGQGINNGYHIDDLYFRSV